VLFASPALASLLLLFDALPLPSMLALLVPPLPPFEEALASPELPDRAVVSPSPLYEELLDELSFV